LLAFGLATGAHSDALDVAIPAATSVLGVLLRRWRFLRGFAVGVLILSLPIFLLISGAAIYDALR
jgi:hypothetical protein